MKKASRNLVLRSETLRTLANMELARAVGGADSGDKQCPAAVAADSGAFQCPYTAAVATAAGR
jgi:hypothetical protein